MLCGPQANDGDISIPSTNSKLKLRANFVATTLGTALVAQAEFSASNPVLKINSLSLHILAH